MKKNLTFIIFTVLIITSCSQSVNKGVNNWKETVTQEHIWDTQRQLKAIGWNATDEVQWSVATWESNFINN